MKEETIHIQPPWIGVVNICILALESGGVEARSIAVKELREIGRYLDKLEKNMDEVAKMAEGL